MSRHSNFQPLTASPEDELTDTLSKQKGNKQMCFRSRTAKCVFVRRWCCWDAFVGERRQFKKPLSLCIIIKKINAVTYVMGRNCWHPVLFMLKPYLYFLANEHASKVNRWQPSTLTIIISALFPSPSRLPQPLRPRVGWGWGGAKETRKTKRAFSLILG